MDESWFDDDKKITGMVNFKRALVFIAFYHDGVLTARAKSFTGIANIGVFNIKQRQEFNLMAVTKAGQMKLVAVNHQKEIISLSETGNETGKRVYFDPGRYRIRAIGIKTSYEVTMSSRSPQADFEG